MPAIASLSASVKSPPFVCAPSRNGGWKRERVSGARGFTTSNGPLQVPPRRGARLRRTRYGDAEVPSGDPIADIERERDCRRDNRIFEHDIVEPVTRERCFWLAHETSRLAASCFCMVVLASHSSPTDTELRCWAV